MAEGRKLNKKVIWMIIAMCWSWLQGGKSLRSGRKQIAGPSPAATTAVSAQSLTEVAPGQFTLSLRNALFQTPVWSTAGGATGLSSFSLVHRPAYGPHTWLMLGGFHGPFPNSSWEEGQTSEKEEGKHLSLHFQQNSSSPSLPTCSRICLSPLETS